MGRFKVSKQVHSVEDYVKALSSGKFYFSDIIFPKDFTHEKLFYYGKNEKEHKAIGAFVYAECLYRGLATQKNVDEARIWYEKSFNDGFLLAGQFLADSYTNSKDYPLRKEWQLKTAKAGLPLAEHRLGKMYEEGYVFDKSEKDALYWYELSAKHDYDYAILKMGYIYRKGLLGVKPDKQKAVKWLDILAQRGDLAAKAEITGIYGFTPVYVGSFNEFIDRIEKGMNPFHVALSSLFSEEDFYNLAYEEARDSALSCYMLSIFKSIGYGCEKDPAGASYFLIHSAKHGYYYAVRRAVNYIQQGKLLVDKEEDFYKIHEWGIKLNLTEAYYGYASCYLDAIGVDKDIDKAYAYFQKGAMLGNKYCQKELGNAYIQGLYLDRNERLALYWWKQAAKQNEPHALVSLAIVYERGNYGESIDLDKSLQCYIKAKENGYCEDLSKDIERIKALIK